MVHRLALAKQKPIVMVIELLWRVNSGIKTMSNANLLSTPSIMTIDNQEAKIVVGQNVPFITGSKYKL
jgi:Flp pilus assembly secretin CpaC